MPVTASSFNAAASPDALLASLRWRFATKKFDPSKKIPAAAWDALEDALVLAPSSHGLQPWKFFVVEDPDLRARLKAASRDQSQITDADKLVVFAVKKDYDEAELDRFMKRVAEIRGVPAASLDGYKKSALAAVSRPADVVAAWLTRQVYIALGVFLTAAAALGVDACPMEGFDRAKYDEILGLPAFGYNAVVVAAAGARAADDVYATRAKVRFAKSDVIARL